MNSLSEEEVLDFLDGACTTAARQRIEAAIVSNAADARLYTELKAMHDGLAQMEVLAPTPDFTARLVGQLEGKVLRKKQVKRHWLRSRPIMVVLVCLVTLWLVTFFTGSSFDLPISLEDGPLLNETLDTIMHWGAGMQLVAVAVVGLSLLFVADRFLHARFKPQH